MSVIFRFRYSRARFESRTYSILLIVVLGKRMDLIDRVTYLTSNHCSDVKVTFEILINRIEKSGN